MPVTNNKRLIDVLTTQIRLSSEVEPIRIVRMRSECLWFVLTDCKLLPYLSTYVSRRKPPRSLVFLPYKSSQKLGTIRFTCESYYQNGGHFKNSNTLYNIWLLYLPNVRKTFSSWLLRIQCSWSARRSPLLTVPPSFQRR